MRAIVKEPGKPPRILRGVKEVVTHQDGSIGVILHKQDEWEGLTADMKPHFLVNRRYSYKPGVKVFVREG